MDNHTLETTAFFRHWDRSLKLFIGFWVSVYLLAIFQDYLYSTLRDTRFYWSETCLFNTYWLLFVPLAFFVERILEAIGWKEKPLLTRLLFCLGLGLFLSLLHAFLFANLFTGISNLVFSPPHRFSGIFKSVLSNQFYITIVAYVILPFVFRFVNRKKSEEQSVLQKEQEAYLRVKQGSRQIKVAISEIRYFVSNRPYTTLRTSRQKLLISKSLKELESTLDSNLFIRVHRSVLVNKMHISEITSRQNGDYDATMDNGVTIRLSRHYRKNWELLIL